MSIVDRKKAEKAVKPCGFLRKNVPIEKTKKIYDFLFTKRSIWINIEEKVSYLLILRKGAKIKC